MEITVRRLGIGDEALASDVIALMSAVFETEQAVLSSRYLARLLASPSFWLLAAFDADGPVGGLTAHTLPMTRSEASEVFVYDLAVRVRNQRRGVGKALVAALRAYATAQGIDVVFVPASVDDRHAIDFYGAAGGIGEAVTIFTFES